MKTRSWVVLIALFIAIIVLIDSLQPKELDWRPTFDVYDKIPFGTYIFNEELTKVALPEEVVLQEEPFSDLAKKEYIQYYTAQDSNKNYVYLNDVCDFTKREVDQLLDMAQRGNYFFLSANEFSQHLQDTLGFETRTNFIPGIFNRGLDTILLCSLDDSPMIESTFLNAGQPLAIEAFDATTSEELGQRTDGTTNFISIDYGIGRFYIHTSPSIYTNYNFIENDNLAYVNNSISLLPKRKLYYNIHYVTPSSVTGLLHYAKSNKALNSFLWLLSLLALCFLFLTGKRKQAPIPIIEPLKNETKAFVKTISSLYTSYNDPRLMGLKKVKYFQETVLDKYGINLKNALKDEQNKISKMFEFTEQEFKTFTLYCNMPIDKKEFTDEDLKKLNGKIEGYKVKFKI